MLFLTKQYSKVPLKAYAWQIYLVLVGLFKVRVLF